MKRNPNLCRCGCEMIEIDGHFICSRYFEDIKKMMEILKEKLEEQAAIY